MDTNDLQTFLKVAQLGSIAGAARTAGLDASTVSRQVMSLEAQLGTRLFNRTTRKLTLTEAGEIFLSRVGAILEDLEAARAAATASVEQPTGGLRITASHAFGEGVLAPLLAEFCGTYPAIDIDLILTDDVVDLVARQIDLGFRNGPRPSGDLIVSKLLSTERRLVASDGYLENSPVIHHPRDLANHICLATSNAPHQQTWYFQREGEQYEMAIHAKVKSASTISLHRCVRDGLGISLLVDWLVEADITNGLLSRLLPEWTIAAGEGEAAVWVVYPSRAFLPLKTRKFIDFVRGKIGSGRIGVSA
jgi:DNA-binding transcriptional LysR family regulator